MRVRIYAVTFGALTDKNLSDTFYAKGRGAEDALRRLLGVLSKDSFKPYADIQSLLAGSVEVERVIATNSAMDEPYLGSLPLTTEQFDNLDRPRAGEED